MGNYNNHNNPTESVFRGRDNARIMGINAYPSVCIKVLKPYRNRHRFDFQSPPTVCNSVRRRTDENGRRRECSVLS